MKTERFLSDVKDGEIFEGQARLLTRRHIGKICFCDVRFRENCVQIVLNSHLSNYDELAGLPLGSLLYIRGQKIVTKTGMSSLEVLEARKIFIYNGSMPDKYHGLNAALRYKKRAEDLIVNSEAFVFVQKMSMAIAVIRRMLYDLGFHEFITGVLQETFEAGQAQPFSTQCRATDKTLYLSLTSELKLKRLIIAGFNRVFEIAQSFRNEGIDTIHSPEFSMVEIYEADADYYKMMELLEAIVAGVILECEGKAEVAFFDEEKKESDAISYRTPFIRLPFKQAFETMIGDWKECNCETLSKRYPDSFNVKMTKFTWLMKVIEKLMVTKIIMPTFLTELPVGMSPFVRSSKDGLKSERAFLIAKKTFLADIYTDENNYQKVEAALKQQSSESGNMFNREYLEAMSLGMPQTAGIGLGLNRLFMLMLGSLPNNIKETILYPAF